MMPSSFLLTLLTLLVWSVSPTCSVWAQYQVLEVDLVKSIENREPIESIFPPAYCEKDQKGQDEIPIIDSTTTPKVFFWNRIASSTEGLIRHTWHHRTQGTWKMVAHVDLTIAPSPRYRLWSSKSLHPSLHTGDWMIVTAPSEQPNQVLCLIRFSVQ